MQNDSFKMRQHYAPYNRSEESHRVSEEYIFYGKPPSREFAAPTARKDDKIACHRERKRGDPLE